MLNSKRKILIAILVCLSAITIAGTKNLTGPVNKERIALLSGCLIWKTS